MINSSRHKEKLKSELIQITADLQELGIHNPEVTEDWIETPGEVIDAEPDENISADRSEGWQEHRSTLAALETRYNNINRALKKIKERAYGMCEMCEICGVEIEEDRLQINPAARTDKTHMNDEAQLPK